LRHQLSAIERLPYSSAFFGVFSQLGEEAPQKLFERGKKRRFFVPCKKRRSSGLVPFFEYLLERRRHTHKKRRRRSAQAYTSACLYIV
jgi:hypothetical protein